MKTKRSKRLFIIYMIIAMSLLYGFVPPLPNADAVESITNAKALLTDSDWSAVATTTFTFTTGSTTPTGGYIDIALDAGFTGLNINNVTCPASFTKSAPGGNIVRCTADNDRAPGVKIIIVGSLTNPATVNNNGYMHEVRNYSDVGVLRERVEGRVYIIDDVTMTAHVSSSLSFTIGGVNATTVVNGVTCNATSTATTTPFGNLGITASTTVCQNLVVATNADDGFSVTVWENHEMLSDSGSNINSFNNGPDGTGSSTPVAWDRPYGWLDSPQTYGHMGFTADDATLSWGAGGDPFGTALYMGFATTTPVEIMYHNGPSNGTIAGKGIANVAYTTEITALQEAGDYESTLTYIATPQF